MKKYTLVFLMLILFPITIFAHGQALLMFSIFGYVFIFQIIIGIFEYYLIKRKFEIQTKGIIKLIILNLGITVIGYLILFYFIDNFHIVNERTLFSLLMGSLTIFQIICKILFYNLLILSKKSDLKRLTKFLLVEMLAINLLCYISIFLMI
jgi:hypothetical protein